MNLQGVKITELDLDFVKEYLKVDYPDEDNLIQALIVSARSYIETMLGYKITQRFPYPSEIPSELTIACLLIISHWFDNRQMQTTGTLGNEMGFAVSAIVDAHKDHMKEHDEELI